jgi:hypothetical protein
MLAAFGFEVFLNPLTKLAEQNNRSLYANNLYLIIGDHRMFKISDVFTLSTAAISSTAFNASYFSGDKARAVLTAISAVRIYVKQSMLVPRGVKI